MKEYKIHPDVIDAIAEIYNGDSTIIDIGKERYEEMEVTSGIKQGCTGSTTLFKLVTYKIIKELEKKGEGFKDEVFNIRALFFADDGLVIAKDIEEAKQTIKDLIIICEEYGLQINKEKSNILTYNIQHEENEIEGIKIVESIKYLGVTIDNKRNMFKTQKRQMIEKAEKLANLTYPIIAKSANKVIVDKTFWK